MSFRGRGHLKDAEVLVALSDHVAVFDLVLFEVEPQAFELLAGDVRVLVLDLKRNSAVGKLGDQIDLLVLGPLPVGEAWSLRVVACEDVLEECCLYGLA